MIEPTRQIPQNSLGLLGGRTIPSLTQYPAWTNGQKAVAIRCKDLL